MSIPTCRPPHAPSLLRRLLDRLTRVERLALVLYMQRVREAARLAGEEVVS